MKIPLFLIGCFLVCLSYGQETGVFRGTLVDSSGQAVPGIAVLMMRADSMQVEVDYSATGDFCLRCADTQKGELLLYVSAVGYNSRYIEVERTRPELGKVVMTPLSMFLEEASISARKPIVHKFERGRDEYTVPEWMGERSYDVNALLALVPGLMSVDGDIEIAGIGVPTYLLNGREPMPGELESLNPKHIEKVSIIRMPSAKYGKDVTGIIDIRTRKLWHDYFNSELKYGFDYSNRTTHQGEVWVDFKQGKQYHIVRYNYQDARSKYMKWSSHETDIEEEDFHYLMTSEMSNKTRGRVHNFSYAFAFQFNDYHSLRLSYLLSNSKQSQDNFGETVLDDGERRSSSSHLLRDGDMRTQMLQLTYENTFDKNGKRHLKAEVSYNRSDTDYGDSLREFSRSVYQGGDSVFMVYGNVSKGEGVSAAVDYGFTLWDALELEAGAWYSHSFSRNTMEYRIPEGGFTFRRNSDYAEFYLNAEHGVGRFYYQFGVRGQYVYQDRNSDKTRRFHFQPSVGMAYAFDKRFNVMLSYKRNVDYPTFGQDDPSVRYVHQYMYKTGDPFLKPTTSHAFMNRWAFPYELALTCRYEYKRNDILTLAQPDEENPLVIVLCPDNIDKTHSVTLNLSWSRMFGIYYLNLSTDYSQFFADAPLIEGNTHFKPRYRVNMTHLFTLSPKIQATVGMHYQTAYNLYNTYVKEAYVISPKLLFSLLDRRLKIHVAGNNLLNAGRSYTRDRYGHTLSIEESNQKNRRSFSLGLSYCFKTAGQ